ncbi:uncharacterized protein LOC130636905 [Hydractinia symbiolongicarpus]|uniref:uncharacterized protein LOC130636905 n=1 Tax=Hydractinia symbiolongicarpus TaxID=13093 RepID=UPI00254FD0C7|nr:uncharacterized protein LOC130636905 [Hydractinia symbiolongicarpus]
MREAQEASKLALSSSSTYSYNNSRKYQSYPYVGREGEETTTKSSKALQQKQEITAALNAGDISRCLPEWKELTSDHEQKLIKDAYYSVHIDDEYQKFLKFYYDGVLYQFTCLPNGLCSGPRKFTRLPKPPLAVLRSPQCLVSGYIDDLITMHTCDNGCFVNIKRIVSLLGEFGFSVHPDKSHFLPTQTLEYLGSIIDSVNTRVYLTDSKKKSTNYSFHAVLFGKLRYRDFERLKIDSLRKNYGNFDSYTTLSANAIGDIQCWCDNITSSYNPMSFGNPTMTISTDASKLGLGAVCSNSQTGGLFSEVESEQHINVLELKAILSGLRSLCDSVFNTHIKVLCDNTTAVHCITNMGSCRSIPCDIVVKHIWDWAIRYDNWLNISHIPGLPNVEADVESRKHEIKTEWKLSEKIFLDFVSHFQFFPDIDLFTSRINTQLATFVSYRPHPCATLVNAFTFNWHGQKVLLLSAFRLCRCVQKAIQDKIEGLIVVPNWPNQIWYPLLLQVAVTNPYVILPSREQLFLPNQPSLLHPLHKNLELLAVFIRTSLFNLMFLTSTKNLDPTSAPTVAGADFLAQLFYSTKLEYSALNTARFALSSILKPDHGITFSKQTIIKRLLRGIFKERITLPRYTITFDVDVELRYLDSLPSPEELSLQ